MVALVAQLRHEKGIDVLISAATRLSGSAVVVIVGSGPHEQALRTAARRAGAPVTFASHQNDVAPWLAISDVVAIPSRREAFGRTTIEAMAAAKPIVASRVGGLRVAVDDGVTGLLVEPENGLALARGIDTVLGDPGLAAAMARENRRLYEARYTIPHMTTSWREALERAVAGRGRVEPGGRAGSSRCGMGASPSETGPARSMLRCRARPARTDVGDSGARREETGAAGGS